MRLGEPVDPRLPWVRHIHDLDEARSLPASGPRLREYRRIGRRLGDALSLSAFAGAWWAKKNDVHVSE